MRSFFRTEKKKEIVRAITARNTLDASLQIEINERVEAYILFFMCTT